MPLVRLWSGKFNKRVPEPLPTNAGHLVSRGTLPGVIGDQFDLLRHIPARSRGSAYIDIRFKPSQKLHEIIDLLLKPRGVQEAFVRCTVLGLIVGKTFVLACNTVRAKGVKVVKTDNVEP